MWAIIPVGMQRVCLRSWRFLRGATSLRLLQGWAAEVLSSLRFPNLYCLPGLVSGALMYRRFAVRRCLISSARASFALLATSATLLFAFERNYKNAIAEVVVDHFVC